MTLLILICIIGLIAGLLMPLRWGVFGFLTLSAALFLLQAGINAASGFEGASIEESLLLFNGSYVAYLGFHLQITYRAFMLPVLALATPLIWRLTRAAKPD